VVTTAVPLLGLAAAAMLAASRRGTLEAPGPGLVRGGMTEVSRRVAQGPTPESRGPDARGYHGPERSPGETPRPRTSAAPACGKGRR
jgi:hypothetical protein